MKKLIITAVVVAAMLIGFVKPVNAQVHTGTTTLNVVLTDAYNIAVNDAAVTLAFNTAADYSGGVTVTQNNHLTVTSNQAYTINVKISGDLTGTTTPANTVGADAIQVEIPTGQSLGGSLSPTSSGLTTGGHDLLTNGTAAAAKNINVRYYIPSATSSSNAILGKAADTYFATVTYTITQ